MACTRTTELMVHWGTKQIAPQLRASQDAQDLCPNTAQKQACLRGPLDRSPPAPATLNQNNQISSTPTTQCSGHAMPHLAGSVGAQCPLQDSPERSDDHQDAPLTPWSFCHWHDEAPTAFSDSSCLVTTLLPRVHRPNTLIGEGQLQIANISSGTFVRLFPLAEISSPVLFTPILVRHFYSTLTILLMVIMMNHSDEQIKSQSH